MKSKKRIIYIFLFSAFICTSIVTIFSQKISETYFEKHTFFWDPVMTYSRNIPFYERMEKEANLNPIASRLNFAELYFKAEPKAPIFFIPVILLAPKLLLSPWVIMPVGSLMVCIFLFLLGYSIYIRTKEWNLSIFSMFIVSVAPGLYNPEWGMASGWVDFPAGFLLGASIISFLNWHTNRKTYWLVICSVLFSFSIMGRYVIVAYGAIILFPIFMYSIYEYYKKERNVFKTILFPIISIITICSILAGYFLLYHLDYTITYYTKMAYAVSTSIFDSFKDFFVHYKILGVSYTLTILVLIVSVLVQYIRKQNAIHYGNVFMYIWIIVSLPFFWIVYFRSVGNYGSYLIQFPIFMIVLIPIISMLKNMPIYKKFKTIILLALSSIIILFLSVSVYQNINFAKEIKSSEKGQKELNISISKEIKNLSKDQTWCSFFASDYSRIISSECFYNFGVYPTLNNEVTFYGYSTYWKFYYEDKSVQEISQEICKKIENSDVFITFNSIEDVNKTIVPNYLDDFSITKEITSNVVNYMNNNTGWIKENVISTNLYSNLALYKKKLF